MFSVRNYVKAKSLEEAYELNQKKTSVVLGGTVWLKMGNRQIQTAIDLSDLGLDKIEETEDAFSIGAMVSLRQLETHKGLHEYFHGALKEATRHIVGVQFRNCATVGGSVYGRFGFSDILTCLLAMDTYVEMFQGGIIPLKQFIDMPYDRDILVRVIIKKDNRQVVYLSHRNSATDFPVLACAVAKTDKGVVASIGARPTRATLVEDINNLVKDLHSEEERTAFSTFAKESIFFGSNMRASKEYRQHLTGVLVNRGLCKLAEEK